MDVAKSLWLEQPQGKGEVVSYLWRADGVIWSWLAVIVSLQDMCLNVVVRNQDPPNLGYFNFQANMLT